MLALSLYRSAATLFAPMIRVYLGRRQAAGKEDPLRLDERFGIASRPRPSRPLVWIHAASIGESLSVLPLLARIVAERNGLCVLLTTGTVTSARLMADRLPAGVTHQYVPIDRPLWTRRFLDHWRPDLALWVESEFWPTLLTELDARRIPTVLVNARISTRSFDGWRRFPRLIRRLLQTFDLSLAQSTEDAARLDVLGAPNVRCPGNLKFAAPPPPADEAELERLRVAIGKRPLWLAASTHPGEEEAVLAAQRELASRFPGLMVIIVPRHPARGPAIAQLGNDRGFAVALRSANEAIDSSTEIYVADGMGELGLFYRLARVAFLGGSLVPHGGQNLLEAAKLGCAVVHGPHMGNFRAVCAEMTSANATEEVADAATLAAQIGAILADSALRERRAAAGRRVATAKEFILDDFMAELAPYLDRLVPRRSEAIHARA